MVVSLLDNDLYKYTMQQVVFHNYPNVQVEYDLSIRSLGIDLRPFRAEIEREIRNLDSLQLAPEEYAFLRSIRYLSEDYIDWLNKFQFNTAKHVVVSEKNDNLSITVKGDWLHTILYEVPILAIVSEIYHARNGLCNLAICTERLEEKINLIKTTCPHMKFSEFGTRRRNSFFIQNHVIEILKDRIPNNLFGTSNVYLAMVHGLRPIGTIAHEVIQAGQVLYPLKSHQKDIMDMWNKEFDGDLGIMLTDTLGIDAFLKDFTLKQAKVFDGVRQDSGDPVEVGFKVINHYKKLGIDPMTKVLLFSDNLNIPKAIELFKTFSDLIKVSFGIGTNLSNDCGDKPLSIVMKMQLCNGMPVAKLSDSPGKEMCRNPYYLDYLRSIFKP